MTIMYALGWTQHTSGSQNIRTAAMIQLLLGNIGVPGGGINALRGHSNVQGITDIGTLTAATPGYMAMPTDAEPTLEAYLAKRTFTPLRARTRPATGRTTRSSTSASSRRCSGTGRRRTTSSATSGCPSSTWATTC